MLSLPEFQVIQGTCERISADKAPPPLFPRSNSMNSTSSTTNSSVNSLSTESVDLLSGIPLVSLPRQDARFSYFNTGKQAVPFLKVSVTPSVISIGERSMMAT
jgi:hypothetical protein